MRASPFRILRKIEETDQLGTGLSTIIIKIENGNRQKFERNEFMPETISVQESALQESASQKVTAPTVNTIMTARLVTIHEKANVARALSILAQHGIRHLVVLDDRGEVAGLFSERDLLKHIAMNGGSQGQRARAVLCAVKDLMIKQPFTVQPTTTIREAARLMAENKIGCLPVVGKDQQRLGIVTTVDVLRFFADQS